MLEFSEFKSRRPISQKTQIEVLIPHVVPTVGAAIWGSETVLDGDNGVTIWLKQAKN